MEITFLGTRGGFPVGGQTSCARVEGDADSFVIDLGSSRLFEKATWIAEADHVLLTHLHPDHITHLASLLIARLNTPGAEGNVSFIAPEPVREYLDFSGLGHIPGWNQLPDVPKEWCGFTLETMQTRHPRKNHAYRISDDSTTLVWTGDATYSEELSAFCAGADVVVCEASMKDCNQENAIDWGHMTPQLFARLMNEAKPATAIATHYTELEPEAFSTAVRPLLHASIQFIAAEDGFVFSPSRPR